MGKRLLDAVTQCKTRTFDVNGKVYKDIGGQGRLTQKAISRIQEHYGAAVRGNSGNLAAMKKVVWLYRKAIWKHRKRIHTDCGDYMVSS